MRNLSILTIIVLIFTFSSCEEEAIIGCIDPSALNYDTAATESDNSCEYVSDQILGNWTVDSVSGNMLYSEDMINNLISASLNMSSYEFEDEFEFPMPSSQAEWDDFALNGVPIDFIESDDTPQLVVITNSTFTVNESVEEYNLDYQLTNDHTIQFSTNEENIEYFDIVEVSESNLVLTTILSMVSDDNMNDMGVTGIRMVMYLSK